MSIAVGVRAATPPEEGPPPCRRCSRSTATGTAARSCPRARRRTTPRCPVVGSHHPRMSGACSRSKIRRPISRRARDCSAHRTGGALVSSWPRPGVRSPASERRAHRHGGSARDESRRRCRNNGRFHRPIPEGRRQPADRRRDLHTSSSRGRAAGDTIPALRVGRQPYGDRRHRRVGQLEVLRRIRALASAGHIQPDRREPASLAAPCRRAPHAAQPGADPFQRLLEHHRPDGELDRVRVAQSRVR